MAILFESVDRFLGNDAEEYLKVLRHMVGIYLILDVGNKFGDNLFRFKRQTGETIREWSIRSDQLHRRLLSALEPRSRSVIVHPRQIARTKFLSSR